MHHFMPFLQHLVIASAIFPLANTKKSRQSELISCMLYWFSSLTIVCLSWKPRIGPNCTRVSWSMSLKQLSNASAVSHPAGPHGERTSPPTSAALLCHSSLLAQRYGKTWVLSGGITLARQWRAASGCTWSAAHAFSSFMCRKEEHGSNAFACSSVFLFLACLVGLEVQCRTASGLISF